MRSVIIFRGNVGRLVARAKCPVAMLILATTFLAPRAVAAEDAAREIVRRGTLKDQLNWQLARNFTYIRRTVERDLDGNGQVKSTEAKTVDVSILFGERYRRLIRKNDQPLDPSDEDKEQNKLNKFVEERQHESEQAKAKRMAKVAKEREKQREFLREVPDAFNFKQLADGVVDGKPVFVIEADPKPGYSPQLDEAKILKKVRAKFWIDKSEYQWVKAEVETLDTIAFGYFIVRVERGSHFAFEQMRVNNEIWLPKHQHQTFAGRIGLIKKVRMDVDVTYSNYRKFTSDSRIISIEAK